MKVLVTCFDAFGGEAVNPGNLVVKLLPDQIGSAEIIKLEIPTVFYKSIQKITDCIDAVKPDFVLSIGQAGGRSRISVERVAINVDDARIPDNENQSPIDLSIVQDGEAAYFSTLPIKDMVRTIHAHQIPAEVSNTAGTFVCNHVMYGALQYIDVNQLNIKSGFIHIPYVPEQIIDKGQMPSMSVETLAKGIEVAIRAMIDEQFAEKTGNVEAQTH